MSREMATGPPRNCYKCGREIGPDETICEICNRAGMATPSATQYHGTMVVAIIAGVLGLAMWGSLALRGVGPYSAEVESVTPAPPDGALVRAVVTNEGTQQGFAKCRLRAMDTAGNTLRTAILTWGPILGGEARSFEHRLPGLPAPPASVEISCS
jgi:hypothetical protein